MAQCLGLFCLPKPGNLATFLRAIFSQALRDCAAIAVADQYQFPALELAFDMSDPCGQQARPFGQSRDAAFIHHQRASGGNPPAQPGPARTIAALGHEQRADVVFQRARKGPLIGAVDNRQGDARALCNFCGLELGYHSP